MHGLNISASTSAPNMVCFVRFAFDMCFAPQHRALFERFNFQKRLDNEHLISPDGSAPAALPSLLFDPPEPQNIGNTVLCDFSTCLSTLIFFLLPFSSLTLPTSALPYVHIVGSLTSKLPFVKYPASFVPDLLPVRMPTT